MAVSDAVATVFPATIPTVSDLYIAAFGDQYPEALAPRVRHYALRAQARASLRGQETWWRLACGLCDRWTLPVLPMDVWTAIAIITLMADAGYAFGSILWMVRTLANVHRYAGLPDPTRERRFRLILGGIASELGTAPRNRKDALLLPELRQIADLAYARGNLRALYELVLLLTLWFGALRGSELVAIRGSHLTFVPSLAQAVTVQLHIPTSKTDQTGNGADIFFDNIDDPLLCPVRALAAWYRLMDAPDGYLFPSLSKTGRILHEHVHPRTITRILKRYAGTIGLDAARIASHSGRAGFITETLNAGVPELAVADHARQADLESLSRYYRPGARRLNLSRAVVEGRPAAAYALPPPFAQLRIAP